MITTFRTLRSPTEGIFGTLDPCSFMHTVKPAPPCVPYLYHGSENLELELYNSGLGTWCQNKLICHRLLYLAITMTTNEKLKLINNFLVLYIN